MRLLGSSIVVHDLHPRVCADCEELGALDTAGVDEDVFARGDFAEPEALIHEPLVDQELYNFGFNFGFVITILQPGIFFLQPLLPPD